MQTLALYERESEKGYTNGIINCVDMVSVPANNDFRMFSAALFVPKYMYLTLLCGWGGGGGGGRIRDILP
jgi:hypothetical protein